MNNPKRKKRDDKESRMGREVERRISQMNCQVMLPAIDEGQERSAHDKDERQRHRQGNYRLTFGNQRRGHKQFFRPQGDGLLIFRQGYGVFSHAP